MSDAANRATALASIKAEGARDAANEEARRKELETKAKLMLAQVKLDSAKQKAARSKTILKAKKAQKEIEINDFLRAAKDELAAKEFQIRSAGGTVVNSAKEAVT